VRVNGELPGDEMPYARCPRCGRVGPPAWWVRDGTGDDPLRPPIETACRRCGERYTIVERAELLALDATVVCRRCATVIRCPAGAEVVLCRVVDAGGVHGCGEVQGGPAAGADTVVEQLPATDPDGPLPQGPGDVVIRRGPDRVDPWSRVFGDEPPDAWGAPPEPR
jgi:ribosomal protein L37E